MQQIIPYSTFENPEDNFDHDIDAPPNTGAQQFVLNRNDQTPAATYPAAHREEPPPYAAATYPAATYPKNTNESYQRVTYESYQRWKSDICGCFSNFPICLVTIFPCGQAFVINMIMHHLRIRNNAASKSKFFIGLAIITILYILRRTAPFFVVVTEESQMTTSFLFLLLFASFFFFCLLFSVRKNVMKDRKIPYSFWENCCTVYWCYCCAICQSANEYSGDDGKQFWKVEIV